MATITELKDSRGQEENRLGEVVSCTFKYLVEIDQDTEDENDAYNLVIASAPNPYNRANDFTEANNLWRKDVKLSQPEGAGLIYADVTYEANQDSISFDFSLQSEKVYYGQPLQTPPASGLFAYVAAGDPAAPDLSGAINVNEHAIEGVDVQFGKYSFTITKIYKRTTVDGDFLDTIMGLVGCVNSDDISFTVGALVLSFDAGELRFDGTQGCIKPTGDQIELPYKFAFSQGVNDPTGDGTGMSPGDAFFIGNILVTVKQGWDYLWLKTQTQQASDGSVYQKAIAAYVDEVYKKYPFAALGL